MRAAWLTLCLAHTAWAGAVLQIDDDRSISLGLGLKTAAGFSSRDGADLVLEGAIFSLGGQYDDRFKLALNGIRLPNGELRVLDAVAEVDLDPSARVRVGRMIVPTDRATLVGPLFSAAWDLPVVSQLPNVLLGRADGLTVWGLVANRRLKYFAGAYRAHPGRLSSPDDLMYSARVSWTPLGEDAGFDARGTELGTRDTLALGAGLRVAPRAALLGDTRGAANTLTADLFFERRTPAGVFTVDAAAYHYTRTVADPLLGEGFASALLCAWMPPFALGETQLQAALRHQWLATTARQRVDLTVNAFAGGRLLRIALTGWSEWQPAGTDWGAKAGLQLLW